MNIFRDAWKSVGDISQLEAKQKYVAYVDQITGVSKSSISGGGGDDDDGDTSSSILQPTMHGMGVSVSSFSVR